MRVLRCLGAGLLLTLAAASALAAGAGGSRQELVEARGSRLYVQTAGSGRPVVFLHGGLHHFDIDFGAHFPGRDTLDSARMSSNTAR